MSTPPPKNTMISAVLVFNNSGQPRLTKFYTQLVRSPLSLSLSLSLSPSLPLLPSPSSRIISTHLNPSKKNKLFSLSLSQDTSVQQRLISEIFTLVSHRPSSACNFLPSVISPSLPFPSLSFPCFPVKESKVKVTNQSKTQASATAPPFIANIHNTQRHAKPDNIPALRNSVFHIDIHID